VVRPKIYARGKIFWIRYFDREKGETQKKSLGLEIDVAITSTKDWWKRSKHRDQLIAAMQQVQTNELMKELGIAGQAPKQESNASSKDDMSLHDLLKEYNEINQLERGVRSKETLAKRAKAVNYILKFDPGLTVQCVNRERVLQLRSWSEPPRYKPVSVRGYFVELKALFDYALRIKLISENPFERITIQVPRRLPVKIKIADQYKLFRFIYQTNKSLFFQAMFQRLTGIRVSDVAKLEWEQFDPESRLLKYINSKKNSEEEYPLSDAVITLFDMMGSRKSEGRMFAYKDGKTTADYLSKACEFVGIQHFASHQLKRDYAAEVGKHKPDVRTYDALLHHEPTTNVVGRKHYDGEQYELMLECLNAAQAHWITFLNEVLDLPQLEEKYAYSNPRVKRLDKK
jgi:integrase